MTIEDTYTAWCMSLIVCNFQIDVDNNSRVYYTTNNY